MRRILVSALIFICTLHSFGAAPNVEKIADEFNKQKIKLATQETKQRQVLSSIYHINKKIKKLLTEQSDLEKTKFLLESASVENKTEIEDLTATLTAQKNLLRKRLSLIYQMGDSSLAKLLFSSASSADLERNLKILTIITQQDLGLIKKYHQTQDQLQRQQNKLNRRLAELNKVVGKIATKEASLAQEQKSKNGILDSIRKSQNLTIAKIQELRQKTKNLDPELYDLLTQPSFLDQRGHLPMPIAGQVKQTFGLVKNQQYGVYFNNKGVILESAAHQSVKAVFSGKISFSGFIEGFGHTIIIDHGDHYYSVYSNLTDIKVKEGDEVHQNDSIANLNTNDNHLYFEIRHFSEPYDPKQWLKWSPT